MGHCRLNLYRVSDHADLSGRGGLLASGRWHSIGRPIVYAAEHPALSVLESLVHIGELDLIPDDFRLLTIVARDEGVATAVVDPADARTAVSWGDAWLDGGSTLIARVPSVVVPDSWNLLINPAHPAAPRLAVAADRRWPWDRRLFALKDTLH